MKWNDQTAITSVMVAVGVGVMLMLSSTNDTVKANEVVSVEEHTSIRKEIVEGDKEVRKELMMEIALLRTEQKLMRKESNASFKEVLSAIGGIKK